MRSGCKSVSPISSFTIHCYSFPPNFLHLIGMSCSWRFFYGSHHARRMKTLHMHHYPACFGFSDAMSPATTALEVSTCKLLTTSNAHIRSHTLKWLDFIRCMFIFLALQHPATGNLNFIWCVVGSKRLTMAQDSETIPLSSCSTYTKAASKDSKHHVE